MLIAEDIPLENIRKIYGKAFPGTNPHHMIPSSRNGSGSQFNLFPYERDAHRAYHHLFWNLKIDEVWDNLIDIHQSIFSPDRRFCYQWWIGHCFLDKAEEKERRKFEEQKRERIAKLLSVSAFQKQWIECFDNDSLQHARICLKYMMLFMIFGTNITDTDSLFDNGNLKEFFKKFPSRGYRLWASEICFGSNDPKVQTIKTRVSKIIIKATI